MSTRRRGAARAARDASLGEIDGGVDSQLRRGLRALEQLARGPKSSSDLARALGVNRSTGLRILQALQSAGYVTRDPETRRYSSVPQRLYSLVANHDDHWNWFERVQPVLVTLRDRFGEATLHAVPANGSMVYMAFYASLHPIAVREQIGTVRPMHCSGLGKAYLAGLDPLTLDRELGQISYLGGTERAPRGPLELRAQVEEVRERGYALDLGETFDDVVCVATPTRIGGVLVGAAGISGPAARLPVQRLNEIGVILVEELRQHFRSG